MILLDRFREEMTHAMKLGVPEAKEARDALDNAAVYVFDRKLVDMALDAVTKAEDVAPYIPLPSEMNWLEFDHEDVKFGLFTRSKPNDLRRARCVLVRDHTQFGVKASKAVIDLDNGGLDSILEDEANRRVIGCLAMLAAPDLLERRRVDRDRLNKKRVKSGKEPLASHDFITLRLSRIEREYEGRATEVNAQEVGTRRKQHFVRSHLRFIRSKGMVLIHPHWRGNATLGTVRPRHLVRL